MIIILMVPSMWRSGWDSNPRYREVHLISSQARYDRFDTAANYLQWVLYPKRFPKAIVYAIII